MTLGDDFSTPPRTCSLVEQKWDAAVTGLAFSDDTAMFAVGDGSVRFWNPGNDHLEVLEVHKGAILSAVSDDHAAGLMTGGDDGAVVRTLTGGTIERIATGTRWIDHVALAPWGGMAWSSGKSVELTSPRLKRTWTIDLPSTCGGLAFAPKGERLAMVHYGGASIASLAYPEAPLELLEWRGSHLAVTWSSDARFLITGMQEAALHIWWLKERKDLHFPGYKTKPRTLIWDPKGKWLATSGYLGALVWTLQGNQVPKARILAQLGQRPEIATALAWHPHSPVLAVGYHDGVVLLAEHGQNGVLFLRRDDDDPITHLAWKPDGSILAYGTENGVAGLADCSRMRANAP